MFSCILSFIDADGAVNLLIKVWDWNASGLTPFLFGHTQTVQTQTWLESPLFANTKFLFKFE